MKTREETTLSAPARHPLADPSSLARGPVSHHNHRRGFPGHTNRRTLSSAVSKMFIIVVCKIVAVCILYLCTIFIDFFQLTIHASNENSIY